MILPDMSVFTGLDEIARARPVAPVKVDSKKLLKKSAIEDCHQTLSLSKGGTVIRFSGLPSHLLKDAGDIEIGIR